MDEWRTLLYPLGFLSSIAFGARFIVQWWESEKAKKSLVPRSFWFLSLAGNFLLMMHSFIQIQFHICLVQVCNAVISWRNLDLMQHKRSPISFKKVCLLLIASILATTAAFAAQDWLLLGHGNWFRIPQAPWQTSHSLSISFFWHALGTIGYVLFSSRFWVQWWYTEKTQSSQLPLSFWWLSLIGALLSIAYFLRINDSVNLIGPLIGLIPYFRNLMLMYKNKASPQKI